MNDIQKEISELWNEAFAKASEKSIELAWERNFLELLNDQEKAANKEALELLAGR
jgi:hypothetical protein